MPEHLSDEARAYVEESLRETAVLQARLAALEAAARATKERAEYESIDRELECLLCLVERGAHEATCPVGVLAALLEDG